MGSSSHEFIVDRPKNVIVVVCYSPLVSTPARECHLFEQAKGASGPSIATITRKLRQFSITLHPATKYLTFPIQLSVQTQRKLFAQRFENVQ